LPSLRRVFVADIDSKLVLLSHFTFKSQTSNKNIMAKLVCEYTRLVIKIQKILSEKV